MRPPDLQKIKAKDVFVAQAVLPENRHRKLVSIAQGFAGIRARLEALTPKLSHSEQATTCAEKTEIDLGREFASKTIVPRFNRCGARYGRRRSEYCT